METWIIILLSIVVIMQAALLFFLIRMIALFTTAPASRKKVPPRLPRVGRLPEAEVPAYGSILRIEMGDDEGSCFRLKHSGSTWIGRDYSANDIVIPCTAVSRRHCRVESDGTSFFVHDLGSTNGTFLNGQPIDTSALRHGDTLAVGSTVMRFLMNPEEDSTLH